MRPDINDHIGGPYLTNLVLLCLLFLCLYRVAKSLKFISPLGTEASGRATWKVIGWGVGAVAVYALMTGGAV